MSFIVFVIISFLPGVFGSLFTAGGVNSEWFWSLNMPAFYPPGWLFGPAWFTIYTLTGAAAYLVYQKNPKAYLAWVFFGAQLILNGLWSYIFFGLFEPLWALWEMALLLLSVLGMAVTFCRVDKRTLYCLLPYIAWLAFAFTLNFYIVKLN